MTNERVALLSGAPAQRKYVRAGKPYLHNGAGKPLCRSLEKKVGIPSGYSAALAPTSGTSTPEYGRNPLTGEPLEAEGQFTAIVTGIVSVALAIGYLGLANALDSRDMAPPPLEAMGDGSARPADEIRAR